MRTFSSKLITFGLCALMLGACQTNQAQSQPRAVETTAATEGILGTTWRLKDFDGAAVVEHTHITARFGDNGRVNGSSGCNSFVGVYTLTGNVLAINQNMATTMRACISDEMMAQESRFLAMLPQMTQITKTDGALVLKSADGAHSLTFRPSKGEEVK